MKRAPALFVSHGSPAVALDDSSYTRSLRRFGESNHPRAIVIVSAHWQLSTPRTAVTASPQPELIYDFGGFSPELYELSYSCPGDPTLARRVARLLEEIHIACDVNDRRGLDHGAWIPLRLTFPAATVPVVQLAMPSGRDGRLLFAMGKALAPLRDEGILLIGSGGAVHNLRALAFDDKNAPTPPWASAFQDKLVDSLRKHDWESIITAPNQWTDFSRAHPTPDHFLPLAFCAGLIGDSESIEPLIDGFEYGSLSMFSFQTAT